MRLVATLTIIASAALLASCMHKGPNPDDPYESVNRKIHKFNMALDATMLKPPAKLYKAVVPAGIRASVNNFYNNIYMIPTFANDLLQAEWRHASDDAGRFVVNSTIGLGGLLDVASNYNLPLHHNDLGLTFAKWGDKKSPYIVIPFLGPSTIRDGMGMLFEYTFMTPYPYIRDDVVLNSLIVLRYIDLRSQFLENDKLLAEALDQYTFIRDAYLQHRKYLITGDEQSGNASATDSSYIDDESEEASDYVDEEPGPVKKSA